MTVEKGRIPQAEGKDRNPSIKTAFIPSQEESDLHTLADRQLFSFMQEGTVPPTAQG